MQLNMIEEGMGAGQSRVERLNWGEPSDPC